jgi:hypothetical protein
MRDLFKDDEPVWDEDPKSRFHSVVDHCPLSIPKDENVRYAELTEQISKQRASWSLLYVGADQVRVKGSVEELYNASTMNIQ